MFLKLVTHEFKSAGKWYLGLYAFALTLSVILGLLLSTSGRIGQDGPPAFLTFTLILTLIAWAIPLVILPIATLVLIVSRFKTNIFGRQGYLTMTLPVTPSQIILSKLTMALFWSFLSLIFFFLCSWLVLLISGVQEVFIESFVKEFNESFTASSGYVFLDSSWIPVLIRLAISFPVSILMIYLSIALGQLAENYQTFLSFGAFFGIGYLVNFIETLPIFRQVAEIGNTDTYLYIRAAWLLLLGIGYFFGTRYLIKNKLNLQ